LRNSLSAISQVLDFVFLAGIAKHRHPFLHEIADNGGYQNTLSALLKPEEFQWFRLRKVCTQGPGRRALRNCGMLLSVAKCVCVQRWKEHTTCWEMDYQLSVKQQKPQKARMKQEQRAGFIDRLLNEAQKQAEDTNAEETPVKEVVPAK
jgi:hypothetical protein